MHMEMEWNMLLLILMAFLLFLQLIIQVMLERKIKRALKKVEQYVKYILEDGDGTSVPINIEETSPKVMDDRQKEQLLQEMLDGFLA